MLKKMVLKLMGVVFAFVFIYAYCNTNIKNIIEVPDSAVISVEDYKNIKSNNIFGKCILATLGDDSFSVGGGKEIRANLTLKLFGFLPIKNIAVNLYESKDVYVGGIPLGFSLSTRGLIIVGENEVENQNGKSLPKRKPPIKPGDILTQINGIDIETSDDVKSVLNEIKDDVNAALTIIRNNEIRNIDTEVIKDYDGNNRIGLWVRDCAQGIGTLTFVTDDNKFGALGHPIIDYETGVEVPLYNGGIYNCSLVGINKGERGKTGDLRCLFVQGKNQKGDVLKNTKCGVFGTVSDIDSVVDKNLITTIGSRMTVKLGKAKIVSSVSGVREEYDIEIIKANYQEKSSDKSFVIRVNDRRLLNLTGGIVQGMSGSPIIQDGKLIGAVTHVFLNDPTKGYGVYSDWMIEQVA